MPRELKEMNSGKEDISNYIKDIKQQAEDLVMDKFPRRFSEIEEILRTSNFSLRNITSAHNEPNSDKIIRADDAEEHVSKKRKCGIGLSSASSNECNEQVIPCNNFIIAAAELMKPHMRQLLEDAKLLEIWIQFLTPQAEIADDLINSVLDNIYNEIEEMKSNAEAFSNQVSAYFLSRGKVIAKVMKYPQLDDYRRSVQEMDEDFLRHLRTKLCDARNQYATLHQMILKNWEKIKKPRIFDPRAMY